MAKKTSKRQRKRPQKSGRRSRQRAQGKVIHQQTESAPQIAAQSEHAHTDQGDTERRGRGHDEVHLSLCMIVKNEEQALPNCLGGVQGLIDELIVVDTGSTDRTVEIARNFGAKVYHFEWRDDFAAARNESIKYATGDWILWLDADDILPEKYHGTIRQLLEYPKDQAFFFRLENIGGDESSCYQLRMFPNLPGVKYTMPVHEQVLPSLVQLGASKMVNLDVSVIHTGYTDAETIAAKNARYMKIMEEWLGKEPQDYVTRSHLARTYHTDGRYEDAIREYRIVINDSPCREENELIYTNSLIFLGRSQLNIEQYDGALRAFEEVLERDPNYDIAHMCLGETYTLIGEVGKAVTFLEKIRDKGGIEPTLLPIEIKSLNYFSRYFLAQNYEQQNRLDEAIDEYRAAIQIQPSRSEAPTKLAQLLANGGNFEEAHRVLAGAIQANPEDVENYLSHAVLYLNEKRYDDAEAVLQTALNQDATQSRAHFQLGQLCRLRGNLEGAEQAYQKAIENNPDYMEAHADLGHLYLEGERFDEAEMAFEDAIRAYKESGNEAALDTLLGYAYCCASHDNHNKVMQVYQDVLKQFPDAPIAMGVDAVDLATGWVDLARMLLDSRLPKMAEYAFKTALALHPESDRAAEGLGDVLMGMEKYSEAQEQYEKALQIAADRQELFFKLCDCYLKLNAPDVAKM